MNIFTKLALGIMLCGIAQNVCSQPTYMNYKKIDIPFYDGNAVRSSFLRQPTATDTIWLPAAAHEIGSSGNVSSYYIYEYHENGLLKKVTNYSAYTGDVGVIYECNNTYIDPLMDIPDTIFYNGYVDFSGEYQPPRRYYYNNRQADSSYWEEYYQVWDEDQWKTGQRIYVHLLDTATVSEFQDHVEYFDGSGRLFQGWKAFLTFEDHDNVSEAIVEIYDISTNQYKVDGKYTYLYNEEGKCHTYNYYAYTSSGTWQLEHKLTDLKWFEFHGFDNGDVLFFGKPIGMYDNEYSPKNKNKLSNLEFWGLYGNDIGLVWIDTIEWEIKPFSCHYFHYSNVKCIVQHYYYDYNEYYHITAKGSLNYDEFYAVPCHTDPEPASYVIDDFINKYDDRQRHYEYIQNQTVHLASFPPDSIIHLTMSYVIDSFTYVGNQVGNYELPLDKHALLIVPNPRDETVRITATDDIAIITLYASDGRLAYSQDGSEKEIIVNLHGLSKGVYIVQARLKNGGIQTGKVVVR